MLSCRVPILMVVDGVHIAIQSMVGGTELKAQLSSSRKAPERMKDPRP